MILSDFKTLIRAYVSGAKIAVITETMLELLINKGVDDVNIRASALTGDKKFNVTAESRTYVASSVISNFVAFAEGGLWWNAGSASSQNWRKLDPLMRQSLNDQFPRWMSQTSDNPIRYIHEGDNIIIDPIPKTTLTDGFWAFYVKKATAMTQGTHYPFSGSTTEIANLLVLDDAIIDYVRWKLNPILGKKAEGVIVEEDYRKSLAEKIQLFKRRLDISANPYARFRGPTIG